VLRHSAAHVFAQALQRLHPEATLTIGPPTDEGFYYDVTDVDLDEDDLDAIEEEMDGSSRPTTTLSARSGPVRRPKRSTPTTSTNCRYSTRKPTTRRSPSTCRTTGRTSVRAPRRVDGRIGATTLLEVSAAYWRGDEGQRHALTRVYGTAFASESDLKEHLELREEALERDPPEDRTGDEPLLDPDGDRSRPPAVPPAGQDRAP